LYATLSRINAVARFIVSMISCREFAVASGPDRGAGDSEHALITSAHTVSSNPVRRAAFDVDFTMPPAYGI
jgi:hypothetical protein